MMVALAREVAIDIFPLEDVLKKLKLSRADAERAFSHPRFKPLVEQFVLEWGSTSNTQERVKVKSAAVLEDILPALHNRLTDNKESLAAQVEGIKALRTLAGFAERDVGVGGNERFHLEIHIGDGKPKIVDITPGPQNLTSGVNLELSGGIE